MPAALRLAVLLCLAAPAAAQELRVAAGAVAPAAGRLAPGWSAGPGLRASAALGTHEELRATLDVAVHDTEDPALPAFVAVGAFLGWSPTVALGPLRLAPGVELGAVHMRFDDGERFGERLSAETELGVGLFARASVAVGGPVEAWAEGGVRRVFLSTPADLAAASAGLALRLPAPRLVRDALE